MKHCTKCGGKLLKETATRYTCTKCGQKQYRNPKGAVAILLFTIEGKLVLSRRGREPEKGKLDPVGGFLDAGENFEEAMYRELEEETGLNRDDISGLNYLGSTYNDYVWDGETEAVASAYFTATLREGAKLAANDDVASLEYFDLSDIPQDEFAWESVAKMIDEVKKRK